MRGEQGRGEEVTYARACARSYSARIFFLCMSAWQEFQQGRGEGVSKSAHYPRTGSDRAWGGLVWFGYQRLSRSCYVLKRSEKRKKTVERRIPHPEEVGNESVCRRILTLLCSSTSVFLMSWQPYNNKTLKILFFSLFF